MEIGLIFPNRSMFTIPETLRDSPNMVVAMFKRSTKGSVIMTRTLGRRDKAAVWRLWIIPGALENPGML